MVYMNALNTQLSVLVKIIGELCQLARARHLCLFHHEPVFDDAAIDAVLAETRRLEEITRGDAPALRVSAAYDGLEIPL